jgi:DNA-binding transcriptional regulator YiaG
MSMQLAYRRVMNIGGITLADRLVELREWITTGYARDLRVAAGLSQALVAHDCEVSASTVHRWERGSRLPSGRNVVTYHSFLVRLVERQRRGDER